MSVSKRSTKRRLAAGTADAHGDSRCAAELAYLKAIYTSAPIGLGFIDTDLRYVHVNEALAKINGLPASEHPGRTIRQVLPLLADTLEPLYRRVIETGIPLEAQEIRGTRRPAYVGERFCLANYQPVKADGHVVGVSVFVKDITDRKLAEAQLKTRARQQLIVAALSELALTTRGVQQLMDEAARKLAGALGADLVEVLELAADGQSLSKRAGVGWRTGVPDQTATEILAGRHAGLAIAAQEPVASLDLRNERRFTVAPAVLEHGAVSGIMVVIPGEPNACGVIGVYTKQLREFSPDDVSLLRTVANIIGVAMKDRRSEQALSDAAARVHAIVTTLVDGIITIDEHGIMDSVNPAAEQLFGYPAAVLVGKNVNVLMPQPYRREHDGYIANYLRTGLAKIIGIGREVVGQRKDGTVFPMELAVSEMQVGGKRMFTGVVRDVTERRRLEREILDAAAEEQRRIGQDLHDGLCQELAGIAFAVEVLTQKLAARSAPETANIRKVADLVDQSITHARDLARGLQPVALEAGGLSAALEALAAKVEGLFHIKCLVVCNEPCFIYDNTVATHLYRIAQEAISNAVRHGKAKTVAIDLVSNDGSLRLVIRDDGVGLSNAASDSKGMGLHTMKYRAGLIGGSLTITPGEREGTVVTCVIPSAVVERGRTAHKEHHGQETESGGAIDADAPSRGKAQNQNPRRGRSSDRPRTPR